MISITKNVTIIAALTFIILASTVEETKSSGNSSAGQLTKKQIAVFKKAFKEFDKDGDNVLNFNEFKEIMSVGRMLSPDEIKELFDGADTDHSGTIDIDEYINMMAQEFAKTFREKFYEFDRDNNGYISKVELSELLDELDKHLNDGALNEKFRNVDTDGDGQINYKEFENLFESLIIDHENDDPSIND